MNLLAGFRCAQPKLAVLVLAVWAAGVEAGAVELYSGLGHPAGSGPSDLVLVDLDGDGILDAAMPGKTGDHVAVVLGQGDGTFGPDVTTPVGVNPAAIAAADFDGDGAIDLVTADAGELLYLGGSWVVVEPASVSVLLGVGDGSFTAGGTFDGGTSAIDVETADFDADGVPDLVVSDTVDNRVGVLLGNGDGTFGAPIWTGTGTNAGAIDVADLNGDLVPDLVALSSDVTLLIGNGDGTFGAGSTLVPLVYSELVEVADVDADGDRDIIIVGGAPLGFATDDAVHVFLGDGMGAFVGMPSNQLLGGFTSAATMGDLNGDGWPDLTVAQTGKYSVRLGNGDGTFMPAADYPLGSESAMALAVADADSDGVPDLLGLSAEIVLDGGVQVRAGRWLRFFPGTGQGEFAGAIVPADPPQPDNGIWGLASADVDGDAIADLVYSAQSLPGFDPGWLGVRLGNGDGSFQNAVYTPAGDGPGTLAAAELNGDSLPDVVVANFAGSSSVGVSVLLGSGAGAFEAPVFHPTSNRAVAIASGDLDGNSTADLVVARSSGADVLLGVGDGTFGAAMGVTPSIAVSPPDVALADFDGDSQLDVLLGSTFSEAIVLPGNGDGTFGTAMSIGVGALSVAAADFDSDGNVDIAAGAQRGAGFADVRVLLGNGDGTFQTPILLATDLLMISNLLATDVDADGVLDLVASSGGSDVYVFLGHGDGNFDRSGPFGVGASSDELLVGDFDQNGSIDIVSVGQSEPEIAILFQLSAPPLRVPALGAAGAATLAGLLALASRRRIHR